MAQTRVGALIAPSVSAPSATGGIIHDSVGDDMSYGWNQPNGTAFGREIMIVEFHNDQL
jgi:hypothetical protein